jgi:hypothetical protein
METSSFKKTNTRAKMILFLSVSGLFLTALMEAVAYFIIKSF